MDVVTYALLKKKIEQGGGGKLPENVTLFTRELSKTTWEGTTIPVGTDQQIDNLYFNMHLTDEEVAKEILNIAMAAGGDPMIFTFNSKAIIFYPIPGAAFQHPEIDYITFLVEEADTTEASRILFVHNDVPEAHEDLPSYDFEGWNPIFRDQEQGILTINAINSSTISEAASKALVSFVSPTPFVEKQPEELDQAILKDSNGRLIYPRTIVSQLYENDGVTNASLGVPFRKIFISGSESDIISQEDYEFITNNKVCAILFNVNGLELYAYKTFSSFGAFIFVSPWALGTFLFEISPDLKIKTSSLPIYSGLTTDGNSISLLSGDTGGPEGSPVQVATINGQQIVGDLVTNINLPSFDDLNLKADKSELLDKADRATYATGSGGVAQVDALTILNTYDNYEGKIIEFYANEVSPEKLVSIGWVMKTLDTSEPVLIEIDRNGHTIKWTKDTNYNANEGIGYREI